MNKKGISDIVTVAICSLFLITAICAFFFFGGNNIAEEENRVAASFPSLSAKSLASGSYFEDLSAFVSDSFPFRKELISLNSTVKLALGERESGGVFLAYDGSLIFRGEYNDLETARKNAEALAMFSAPFDIPAVMAIIPRACDVNSELLPNSYDSARSQEIYKLFDRIVPNAAGLRNSVFDALSACEHPFYRTDHHWTTEGAFSAYREILSALGKEPCDRSFFAEEAVSRSFYGTAYSRSSFRFVDPDVITLYRYEGDGDYIVEADSKPIELYDPLSLAKKDKYQVFLGGNYAQLSLSSDKGARPRLLLIKDSYANSLIPFLALHFNIHAIDPRYCDKPISEIIDRGSYDYVLILFSADTLATTPMYNKLR